MNTRQRIKIDSNDEFIYVINGPPVPLARARMSTAHMWDKQKQIKCLKRIELQSQHNDHPLLSGALHLSVIFYFQFPKCSQKKKENLRGKPHVYKPDIDNLIKMLADICSGVVYKDDCIISQISAKKIYDDIPRTEFKLVPL